MVGFRKVFSVSHPRQVALISTAHGVNEFYSIALPPILPLLVTDLNITYTEAGLLVTTYFMMYTVFQLPAGFVADRIGQRQLIAWGMVTLSIGMLATSGAQGLLELLGAQMLAGLGGSTYHPAGMSLISDIQSFESEGRAMGLHGVGGTMGRLFAPVMIGGLAAAFDWRIALAASAIVGIGIAIVFWLLVEVPPAADDTSHEDGVGAAMPNGGSFIGRVRRVASDGIRIPLAGWVVMLLAGKMLFTLQSGAVKTFTATYVFEKTGGSAAAANSVFFVLLAGSSVSTLLFGALSDWFDRVWLATGAFVVSGLVLAGTVLVPTSVFVYYLWFFLIGAAVYAGLPVLNALISQYADRGFSGSLFGVMMTASAIGNAVSPILFGALATEFGIGIVIPGAALVCFAAGTGFLVFGSWKRSKP